MYALWFWYQPPPREPIPAEAWTRIRRAHKRVYMRLYRQRKRAAKTAPLISGAKSARPATV
jgi:hypothetical protein